MTLNMVPATWSFYKYLLLNWKGHVIVSLEAFNQLLLWTCLVIHMAQEKIEQHTSGSASVPCNYMALHKTRQPVTSQRWRPHPRIWKASLEKTSTPSPHGSLRISTGQQLYHSCAVPSLPGQLHYPTKNRTSWRGGVLSQTQGCSAYN